MALNHSPVEVKVREATNPDEPWGPHGSIMAEISKATFSYEVQEEHDEKDKTKKKKKRRRRKKQGKATRKT
jgi:hypothetical protein